jgi:hypothetical protein
MNDTINVREKPDSKESFPCEIAAEGTCVIKGSKQSVKAYFISQDWNAIEISPRDRSFCGVIRIAYKDEKGWVRLQLDELRKCRRALSLRLPILDDDNLLDFWLGLDTEGLLDRRRGQ